MSTSADQKSNLDKIAGMAPLDYFKFIANSEWDLLSDFISFYPDITAVITEENLATVETHFDSIVDLDRDAKIGYGLLHIVCRVSSRVPDYTGVIKSIFARNQISVNSKKANGLTALMIAVADTSQESNTETVKLLIESGANLESVDKNGWTALMFAARCAGEDSNVETVKLLIDAGANLDAVNKCGSAALMLAAKYSGGESNTETVKLLIDAGANLDSVDNDGRTALMIAATFAGEDSNVETVKLLIESGANLDTVNKNGDTFIELSQKFGGSSWAEVKKIIFLTMNNSVSKILTTTTPRVEKIDSATEDIVDWVSIAARTTSADHFERCIPKSRRTAEVYAAATGNFNFADRLRICRERLTQKGV